MSITSWYWLVIASGLVAVLYGIVTARLVLASDPGTDRMKEIAAAVQEGAQAYLDRKSVV